ncbi:ABC transporter substrate-binding protein [Microbacterium sp. zg.Y1090]|uniref:ABC transporter substrate-binding protein n=1 Tax=Microbacterium wangruii TaxID=3049073 RepID=UPI00214D9402|nr:MULTISPECIES: ABC transporter substrate-binding protein [unclassified Microbacterium]MCR2819481.1 ABC transporter substrate-binding protein [Microbacterium sp. zg.Y1090]MDL5487335.1 ABC transporter substrate-binding protein [Microbacterium sp. zg-Y1211]WIM28454.1 ABC transporter substrate-binding protein [Microbacterium sp. zg-Y1090]
MSQQSSTLRSAARRTGGLIAASALAVSLAACSTPAAPGAADDDGATEGNSTGVTDTTVTIGTHTPLTGPAAAGYSSISAASNAYFDYLNDQGGVNGRTIEYIVKDDGYNPANSQTVVRELVQQDEVFAILNGLGTATHQSVLDFLDQNSVPDLFVASGSTAWNQPDTYPNTFGFNADYVVEGAALGQYAADEFPDAAVCMLGQDDDFGDEFLEGLELALGADGITEVQRYSVSNQDVTAQIGALQGAGCDIVTLATINGFTALAVGTAAQLGWFPQWFASSSGADYPTLVGYLGEDMAPKLLQGFTGTNYLPMADDEWVELFREINTEYNGDAPFDGNTIFGMSVAYVFAEALAAAGENPTRESLVAAVQSGDLVGNGILPLAFGPDSHAAYLGVGITTVDQGVQDYLDATYEVRDGSVSAVERQAVPLTGAGVPGN